MQRVARVVVVAAALALVAGECGGGDETELACLEAVAHLDACCPTLDASLFACGGGDDGARCVVVVRSAPIALDESRCICARSCAELVDGGVCARAVEASGAAPDAPSGPPLCP